MTNIAELGLAIHSESAVQAAENLDGMVEAGVRAEQAINKVGESSEQAKARMLALANAALQSSGYQETLNRAYEATAGASAAAAREQLSQSAAMRQSANAATDNSSAQEKVAASEKKATAAIAEQRTQLEQLLAKIDPTTAALARLGDQQRQLEKFKAAGVLDPSTFNEYKAKLQQAESSLTGFGTTLTRTGVSAGQTQAALRQLPAQFTDIFTSLAGGQNPLLVLIQQGGQIKDSFGGIGPTLDMLGAKVKSMYGAVASGIGSIGSLGGVLGDFASRQQAVAEGAETVTEGLGGMAEGANTAADATKNAKEAASALGLTGVPVSAGLGLIVGAAAAAAAAIGLLIYGYNKGSQEADAYNKALILTGNYAGTSADQLADLAQQVSAINGTTGEAAETLAKLAGSALIASGSFKDIADAATAMEDATGKSVDATIAEFVKIAKDPVAAAKELNDQYHFLTASVYSQIVALKEQGDTVGAADLLTKAYADTVQSRSKQITDNLGLWQRAWRGIKDAASEALDGLNSVGRDKTLSEQVEDLKAKLSGSNAYDVGGVRMSAGEVSPKERAAIKEQIGLLETYIEIGRRQSKYIGERQATEEAAMSGLGLISRESDAAATSVERLGKRLDELDKARQKNIANSSWSSGEQAKYEKATAALKKQIADEQARANKPASSVVNLSAFSDAENKLKALTASHQNSMRILDASQKAGLITQQQYAEQKAVLIEREKVGVEAAYQGEIIALESVRDKSSTTGAQRIQIDQKIADARSKMVDTLKKLDADQEVLSIEMQGRLSKDGKAIEAFARTAQDSLDLARQGLSNQLAGFGLSDRERQRLQEDLKIRQDYQKQLEKLTRDYSNGAKDSNSEAKYLAETAILKNTLEERLKSQANFYRDETALRGDWTNGVSRAWRNYVDEASDAAGLTQSAFSNAFDGLEDVFVDFITTGKASFKDFADSVLADLARIVVKQQIMAPLLQSMFGGTPSGGSFGQSAGQMFGGGTGSGFTDALSMGQKAIGLYNSGAGQAFMSGFQSGTGVIGSLSSGLGAGYASLSGAITGNTAAIGSMQAGYTGSAMANWSAGQAASGAGASAGASAAGAGVSALGAVGYGIGGAISGYQQAGMKGAVTGAGGAVAGAYAGAALGSVVPIIGNVIGAAIGAIIGGMVGGSVWGGEWITKDQGLSLGITGGGLDVSGYEDQSKKGGMFGKNKKRTTLTALDPGMQSVLDQSYAAVQDNVFSLFDRLNIELTDGVLDGMNIAAGKMSTKGMSSQEIQDALTKWFGGVADFMTVAVANATGSGTAGYDFAALTEFVNNLYGVNDVIKYLNVGLFEMSVQGGFMAEQLSAMAGGFEAMKASAASYYDGFYTDVEKADHTLAAVNEQFKAMNITLPETRKGYRDMVEALDLTTEYGRQMFVTLTGLAGSAAASFDILEQRATSANQALMQTLETAVNDAMSAVQRAVSAEKNAATEAYNAQTASLNDMLETAQASMTGLKSISSALSAALKSLTGRGDDAVKMLRNQAKATVQSALAIARAGGSLSGFSGLEDALGVISDNDTSLYDSLEAFNREQGRNANLAAELNLITDQQLSADEALLRTVKDQIKVAKQQYDDEMLRLDNQLLLAQQQIDALHGVDNSVISVANAMGKLSEAIAEMAKASAKPAAGAPGGAGGSTLDSLYNELLGRDPDQAGKDYWNNWLNNGGSLGGLSDAIKNDALANGELKKYATGGLVYGPGTGTSDDVLARLSNGEYIINARATAMLGTGLLDQLNAGQLPAFAAGGPVLEVTRPSQVYSGQQTAMRQGGEGDNRELIAEVRQLREDNKQAQFQIAKNTQQLGVLLRKWDTEGAPKERDYA